MNYEIGKCYEFSYLEKDKDRRGRPYFWVKNEITDDKFIVPAMEFQYDWDDIPSKLICRVISLNPIKLRQSTEAIIKDKYPTLNTIHPFRIKYQSCDSNGKQFYGLTDSYGLHHRVYFGGSDIHNEDDVLLLLIDSYRICKNGNFALNLKWPIDTCDASPKAYRSDSSIADEEIDIKTGESQTCEFKSSLVFPAKTSNADIDTQTKVIMQTIAGMLNADGGCLYIGVNDDGIVRSGIEQDFEYINSSTRDPYIYKPDDDHYKLKISNSIEQYLGTDAKSLAIPEILVSKSNHRYCKITIQRSEWPIWVDGKELRVRTGNNTSSYSGDDITKFILRRMKGQVIPVPIIQEAVAEKIESLKFEELEVPENMQPVSREVQSKALEASFGLFDNEKVWGYIYFTPEGKYIIHKEGDEAPHEYEYRVAIPNEYRLHKSYDLVICYDNGDTDLIDLTSAIYGTGRNSETIQTGKERERGWNTERRIINAFCVSNNQKTKDLVAYVSTKNGKCYLKLHELTAIATNPHHKLGNKGNIMLEKDSMLNYAIRVRAGKSDRLMLDNIGLIFRDTSRHNGIELDDISNRYKEIIENIIILINRNVLDGRKSSDDLIADTSIPETIVDNASTTKEDIFVFNVDEGDRPEIMRGERFDSFIAFLNGKNSYTAYKEAISRLIPQWGPESKLFFVRSIYNGLVSTEVRRKVFHYILCEQINYFLSNNPYQHKAISQRDISNGLGIDDSIVSRALPEECKIITPAGIFLKDVLVTSKGRLADGSIISPLALCAYMKEIRNAFPKDADKDIAEKINQHFKCRISREEVKELRYEYNIPNSRGRYPK